MNSITYTQRYLPHELNTKFYACKLYLSSQSVSFVCRKYHISKSSLMRWNKKFDGTKESLIDNHIDRTRRILIHILTKNSSGFGIIITGTLISLYASFMASLESIKGIPDILAPSTAFSKSLAIHLKLRQRKRKPNMTVNTIPLQSSA